MKQLFKPKPRGKLPPTTNTQLSGEVGLLLVLLIILTLLLAVKTAEGAGGRGERHAR